MVIQINYQTLQLPAPFANGYSISLNTETHQLQYGQEFFDRDSLSEEDILQEGFTMQDDWAWEGEIPEPWTLRILELWNKTKLEHEANEALDTWIFIDTQKEKGHPTNHEEWLMMLEELSQVACELSGREQPLDWGLVLDGENLQIHMSFSDQRFTINERSLPWDDYKKFFALIYSEDFSAPENSGLILNMAANESYGIADSNGSLTKFLKDAIG